MSILRMSEWKSGSGLYYTNFPSIIGSERVNFAAQDVMGMTPIEFLTHIVDTYGAGITLYKNDDGSIKWYSYHFYSEVNCHNYVLEINRMARKRNITISDYKS